MQKYSPEEWPQNQAAFKTMASHKGTGYTVNELTDYMNNTFSLQWETVYLKTTGEGPQNL